MNAITSEGVILYGLSICNVSLRHIVPYRLENRLRCGKQRTLEQVSSCQAGAGRVIAQRLLE